MYSNTVKDHFANPRNVGILDHPDTTGSALNEADGDKVQLHLQLDGNIIKDIRMKVMGCVAAIAATSMLTEMVKGQSISNAIQIEKSDIVEALDGLPEQKIRCSLTCIDALKSALESCQNPGNSNV